MKIYVPNKYVVVNSALYRKLGQAGIQLINGRFIPSAEI